MPTTYAVPNGRTAMGAITYTGNSATSSAGTTARTITGLSFTPDLIWVKSRNNGGTWNDHSLTDSVRGANLSISANTTGAQVNVATGFTQGGVGIGASGGFTIVSGTAGGTTNLNDSSGTYVAWNWLANGSGSSNTAGSITSTVSANTTSGFSIATYTGNGTSGATVGHGLGVTPSMIFVKARSAGTYDWRVYHISLTAGYFIPLNNTDAQTQGSTNDRGYIGSVSSSTFTLTTGVINSDGVNGSGVTYVAYSFAPIAGYSAFGKYTGNGSADGPFVFTGFRPAFVMMRRIDSTSNWGILDSSRNLYNLTNNTLYPNGTFAEDTLTQVDLLSNGFKVRGTGNTSNTSAGTYIYMAFAENPFKYANAR